ncbi:hypothetical protein G6F50_014939 [Rhizopus delemar]|uniref:Uncharacterized protein n=1 Tax=Rhizopus delemar TaxID=936053 RepID=A0A9P7C636_9FUNG|nr:hypothetical protein G6F50_014939 [Rhizopus delemar]
MPQLKGPGRRLDVQAEAFGHHADDVLGQAATGDVGHAVDGVAVRLQQRQDRLHVQAGRRHQRIDQLHAAFQLQIGRLAGAVVDAAHQRIAVGVRAGRSDADQHVTGGDAGAILQFALFDRGDGEAGQVVLARGVHVGHFSGFAADQRAAGHAAEEAGDRVGHALADAFAVALAGRFGDVFDDLQGHHRFEQADHRQRG